jgi:hypothetical protein
MSRRLSPALLVPLALALGACSGDQPLTTAEAPRAALAPAPVCLEFNVPPLGTTYGGFVGSIPGATQFVENGIRVSVLPFNTGGGSFFAEARIEPSPVPFGAGANPRGRVRSISWGFDFTGLSFIPKTVTFDWLDQGVPIENLAVNGSPVFIGQLHTPPAVLGGIAVSSGFGAAPGGLQGTIKLTGPVQKVLVGGQPLWVDHVCAYP